MWICSLNTSTSHLCSTWRAGSIPFRSTTPSSRSQIISTLRSSPSSRSIRSVLPLHFKFCTSLRLLRSNPILVVVVCCQEAPPSHDILVFMTGQEEIEALARTCRDIAKHLPDSCGPMVVVPLYASLPPLQQLRVFQPAPKVNSAGCWVSAAPFGFDLLIGSFLKVCELSSFFRDTGKSSSLPTSPKHLSPSPGSNTSLIQGWWRPNALILVRFIHRASHTGPDPP